MIPSGSQPPVTAPPTTWTAEAHTPAASSPVTVPPDMVEGAFWARKKIGGRDVVTVDVLNAYKSDKSSLRPGFFLQKLCHQRIPHEGRAVTPGQVVREFNKSSGWDEKCQLAVARFKQQCCLRNEHIDRREVTTDEVVRHFPNSPHGKLALARFKSECCLMGLRINGQQITPEEVVTAYHLAKYPLGLAHFFSECFLRGLTVHNRPVSAETVLSNFAIATRSPLEPLRFLEQCFVRNLMACGSLIDPDYLAINYWNNRALLEFARLKEHCCLNGHLLFQRQICPDEVFQAYRSIRAGIEQCNFIAQCCLRGLTLAGRPVDAQRVVNKFTQVQYTRKKAIFLAALTLRGKTLNGQHLDDNQVLQGFRDASVDCTVKPVEYLLLRIGSLPDFISSDEAREAFNKALAISHSATGVEQTRHQNCVLLFTAMQHALPVGGEVPSTEQVWQSIEKLRDSYDRSRLKFFFMVHLFRTGHHLNGSQVSRSRVLACIDQLPRGCVLRLALRQWLDEHGLSSVRTTGNSLGPVLNPSLHKMFQIIDRINSWYREPVVLLSGSLSRYLQGLSPCFDDIDLTGTESGIKELMDRMADAHTSIASGLHTNVGIRSFHACAELWAPPVMELTLMDGDLNLRTLRLRGSMYTTLTTASATKVTLSGFNRPVPCLSLQVETKVVSRKLRYLAKNLEILSTQLQNNVNFDFPCPMLFQTPGKITERTCELLLHCLLTLQQAEPLFQVDTPEAKVAQEFARRLHDQLCCHPDREYFISVVESRLGEPDSQILDNKRNFYQGLLNLLAQGGPSERGR